MGCSWRVKEEVCGLLVKFCWCRDAGFGEILIVEDGCENALSLCWRSWAHFHCFSMAKVSDNLI
jgi:hypothetical protein